MSDRVCSQVRLFAPAKVNLGLEITGKRPDGYHDVVTVLEAISIFDVIDILPSDERRVITTSGVPEESNLVTRAFGAIERRFGLTFSYQIRIQKRIPEAAGMGGGSSDAGTVLAWLRDSYSLDHEVVTSIAASLGSDVPFFLHPGTALAGGTGTDLTRINARGRRWYVIFTPNLEIPGKTGALYAQLVENDFSDGSATESVSRRLCDESGAQTLPLRNTFERPLMDYHQVREAAEHLRAAGARTVLPSGAGPAILAVCDSYREAALIVRRLTAGSGAVRVATTISHPLRRY